MSMVGKVLKGVTALAGLGIAFVILTNLWIWAATKNRVFEKIEDLPDNEVALVLGTSRYTENGEDNPFFTYRIQTAARLYKSGKIKHIIVSGDNNTRYYNEPKEMRDALLDFGIPYRAITLDYAGFRTLDSVVRCKEIFGQDKIIIITQRFHSYRAVFIGDFYGMQTVAIAARNLPLSRSLKVEIRETLARSKAVIDLYILKESPRIMGKKETIGFIQ